MLLRRPPVLRGGGRDHHARAARPGARAARTRAHRAPSSALLGLAPKTARPSCATARGRCAARPGRARATACASGPARKCRWTAVLEGHSTVDESDDHRRADAGRESRPATASPAARSTAPAAVVMRAERVGSETLLAQIVRLVGRGPAQPRADPAPGRRVSRREFVPAVVAAVAHVSSLGGGCGPEPRLATRSSTRSRCSSSPAPARSGWRRRCRSWSASAAAHQAGVLIRNAEALELLEKVDTLVVDKTGTLTEGRAARG